jgi:hypothetical protein
MNQKFMQIIIDFILFLFFAASGRFKNKSILFPIERKYNMISEEIVLFTFE